MHWWKFAVVVLLLDLLKRVIQYGGYEIRWFFSKVKNTLSKEQMQKVNNMLTVVMRAIEVGDKETARYQIRIIKDYLTSHTESKCISTNTNTK